MGELEKIDNDTEDGAEDVVEEEDYDDGVSPLKGKNLIIMVAMAIAMLAGIYYFIFGGPKPKEIPPEKQGIIKEEDAKNTRIAGSVPETNTNVTIEEINNFRDQLSPGNNSNKTNQTEEFESLFYEPDLPKAPELDNINLNNDALNLPDISEIERRLAEQRLKDEEERRARELEEQKRLELAQAQEASKNITIPELPTLPELPPINEPDPKGQTTEQKTQDNTAEPGFSQEAINQKQEEIIAENRQSPEETQIPTAVIPENKVPVAIPSAIPGQPVNPTVIDPTTGAVTTGLNSLNNAEAAQNARRQQALASRRQITSVLMAGTGNTQNNKDDDNRGIVLRQEDNVSTLPAITTNFSANRIGDLSTTLLQGKIIHVVLETALNTDLPGTLRAIVSRDVYAEMGDNVLIPKGSRMIGSYAATVARGQNRIAISWNRIIRPDGVSINIDSQAADQFGRSGMSGDINNRYKEIVANALLSSFLSVGTIIMGELLTDTDGLVQTTTDGGNVLNSGMASDYTLQRLGSDLANTTQELLQGAIKTNPTITVPQGTRITVFVNQDLRIPPMTGIKATNG